VVVGAAAVDAGELVCAGGELVCAGVVDGGADAVELAGGLDGLVFPNGFVYWLFPADPPASANAGIISASAPRTISRAARWRAPRIARSMPIAPAAVGTTGGSPARADAGGESAK
jgi:hypothetical protein